MSEHKHNTSRYWLRTEPDGHTVYFITESNAAHSRAEGDPHAVEITQYDYEEAVPEEARDAPFNASTGEAYNSTPGPIKVQTPLEAVEAYKAQCAAHMIQAHNEIFGLLQRAPITHAERVFILEMVKTEIFASMIQQPQANLH